jgi:hypothetical protein
MSGVSGLPSAPGARPAPPHRQGGGGGPALRRRAALGLALRVLAVLAVLAATGTIGLPGAGSATAVPGRTSPRAPAAGAAPQGAPTAERGLAEGADLEPARGQAQPRSAPRAPEAGPASDRVVAPTHAAALFAQHSWYVLPPAPPPAPPPPPPLPTAPPLPYTFVGSLAPGGDPPVFFLAHGDRVIDARVGDRLDGVYQLESAADGQLVFVYLPLNVRQSLAAGVSK